MSVDEYSNSVCSACCADPCAKLAPSLRQQRFADAGTMLPSCANLRVLKGVQDGLKWALAGPCMGRQLTQELYMLSSQSLGPLGPAPFWLAPAGPTMAPKGQDVPGPRKCNPSLREACARLARKAAPKISGAPGVILKWPSGPLALVARWPGGLGGPNGPVASRGLRKLPQKARTQL